MKKKLLIYAHYYRLDVASTGQILAELAEGLIDKFDVTIICVVPSYGGTVEDKYKTQKFYMEEENGVRVIRVRVPEFQKGYKISRIKNIWTYFFRSLCATFMVEKQEYVLAVSQPPILGGLLGVWGKWCRGGKMIYQIQDFNPEQIAAVGYFKSKFLLWLLEKLDQFSCKKSNLVITVGRDLVETVKKRFKKNPGKMPKTVLINNWIDETEIYPLEENNPKIVAFKEKYNLTNKFVITYSGNIGHYYDLLELLKVIQKFKPGTVTAAYEDYKDGKEVIFTFIGAGSLLEKMKNFCNENHMDNVVFIPYQDKEELNYSLNAGDVHWCVNAKGIKGVSCPSKYYGIAAAGKPVLGVLENGSEIRCIIEETKGGIVCEPEDYEAIEENIQWFIEHAECSEVKEMGIRNHKYLMKYLVKENSIQRYIEEILKI